MRTSKSEAWRKVVLRGMPRPAWQAKGAPDDDIVVSCRTRAARNLRCFRFPHNADSHELVEISSKVQSALLSIPVQLEVKRNLQEAERDYLLGCRLVSADFDHRGPGRFVALSLDRTLSVMVNEEDHIRAQVLTPGWSVRTSNQACHDLLDKVEPRLPFARDANLGYLTASPSNAGVGSRMSALFHLLGLAQTGRLPAVLRALGAWGFVARGLFGETSRAVGAFFQLSTTAGRPTEFIGACEYLLAEERSARGERERGVSLAQLSEAATAAITARALSLSEAIKIFSWVRLALSEPTIAEHAKCDHREVDHWLAQLEVHGTTDPAIAARHRAEFCRARIEPIFNEIS